MKRVPLHDLLVLSDSGVWGDEDPKNGVSVLRSTNFNRDGWLSFENLSFRFIEPKKRDSKLLTEGDILLEKSGGGPQQPVGRVCLFRGSDMPHSFGNFIARLRPNNEVLSEYLFFCLWHFHASGKTSHYQKQTTGIRNLEFKRYLTIEIPVPPLQEQRRIVDLLSRAEGIVRLRREGEKKAAELIPALFLDMFGDPATNPKRWPVVNFGSFGECRLGKMLDKKKQTGEFQRPYLRNVNVQWDRIDTYDLLTMDINPREQTTLLLREGDVLICEGGEIGRAAVWHGQVEECYYQKALHKLIPDLTKVRPDFVVWLLWHLARSGTLLGSSTHATIAHLTGVQLKNLNVIAPPVEIQIEFERLVEQAHSIQSQQSAATAKAQAAFDALLAQAFTPAQFDCVPI